MSKRGKILFVFGMVVLILLTAFFCFGSYTSYNKQKAEVSAKEATYNELSDELERLKKEYNAKNEAVVSDRYGVEHKRILADEKVISDVVKRSFEYTSVDEYKENWNVVSRILPKDCSFMQDVFVKEEMRDENDEENATSLIGSLGIKRKCKISDIYYMSNSNGEYTYIVHVKTTPYYGNDVNKAGLTSEQYLITVVTNAAGKVKSFDYIECYLSR
jgi:hypothetical protein